MIYHAKLLKGGKIVIPAELLRQLGFEGGDALVVEREVDHLVLKSRASVLKEIRAKVKLCLKQPLSLESYFADKWAQTEALPMQRSKAYLC